jgi:hypothetical protein
MRLDSTFGQERQWLWPRMSVSVAGAHADDRETRRQQGQEISVQGDGASVVTDLQNVHVSEQASLRDTIEHTGLRIAGQQDTLPVAARHHYHAGLVGGRIAHRRQGSDHIHPDGTCVESVPRDQFVDVGPVAHQARVIEDLGLSSPTTQWYAHYRHLGDTVKRRKPADVIDVEVCEYDAVESPHPLPTKRCQEWRCAGTRVDQQVVPAVGKQNRVALADIHHDDPRLSVAWDTRREQQHAGGDARQTPSCTTPGWLWPNHPQ